MCACSYTCVYMYTNDYYKEFFCTVGILIEYFCTVYCRDNVEKAFLEDDKSVNSFSLSKSIEVDNWIVNNYSYE